MSEYSSLTIGTRYLFQTVNFHFMGTLVATTATDLVLDDCDQVLETGNLTDCIATGRYQSGERLGNGQVLMRSVIVMSSPITAKKGYRK